MTTDIDAIISDLGLWRRIALAAAGSAGLVISIAITSLWATEPGPLPLLTHIAFGAIVAVGAGWTGLAVWALSRRRPLFGRDRVITGAIAVTAAAIGLGIVTAVGVQRGWSPGVLLAMSIAIAQTIGAMWLLASSRIRHRSLLERRHELELQLRTG